MYEYDYQYLKSKTPAELLKILGRLERRTEEMIEKFNEIMRSNPHYENEAPADVLEKQQEIAEQGMVRGMLLKLIAEKSRKS